LIKTLHNIVQKLVDININGPKDLRPKINIYLIKIRKIKGMGLGVGPML